MNINKNSKQLKSVSGACLSLFLLIGTFVYAFQKLIILIERSDFEVKQSVRGNYFTSDDVFTYKNGFNIAFGFTAYDNEQEWILDPTYGELIAYTRGWGTKADGTFFRFFNELETHVCTSTELGLNDDGQYRDGEVKFMPINPASKNFVESYQKKMLCLNEEDLKFYGSWETEDAGLLNIKLRRCHDRPDCKSEEEITEYFKLKFLILLYNQVLFDD